MHKLVTSYLRNAVRAKLGSPRFEPMIATIYATPMCNLRCGYCRDFGAQRNASFRGQTLSKAQLVRLVDILGEVSCVLYVTGGEPTMNPDLGELLAHARRRGFGYLALNTNALTLHEHEDVVRSVDNLVVSLDSLEAARWDETLAQDPAAVRRILQNVEWAAGIQKSRGATLTVTSVVTSGRVGEARRVMDFALGVGAEFSANHLTLHDHDSTRPCPELEADPEYAAFLDELVAAKRRGASISGSESYLQAVRDRAHPDHACTPTTVPHVDWMGRLAYPCREMPGHVLVDVLAAGSYAAAIREGEARWGAPPDDCHRCGERCYLEISALVRQPSAGARELVSHLRRLPVLQALGLRAPSGRARGLASPETTVLPG